MWVTLNAANETPSDWRCAQGRPRKGRRSIPPSRATCDKSGPGDGISTQLTPPLCRARRSKAGECETAAHLPSDTCQALISAAKRGFPAQKSCMFSWQGVGVVRFASRRRLWSAASGRREPGGWRPWPRTGSGWRCPCRGSLPPSRHPRLRSAGSAHQGGQGPCCGGRGLQGGPAPCTCAMRPRRIASRVLRLIRH